MWHKVKHVYFDGAPPIMTFPTGKHPVQYLSELEHTFEAYVNDYGTCKIVQKDSILYTKYRYAETAREEDTLADLLEEHPAVELPSTPAKRAPGRPKKV